MTRWNLEPLKYKGFPPFLSAVRPPVSAMLRPRARSLPPDVPDSLLARAECSEAAKELKMSRDRARASSPGETTTHFSAVRGTTSAKSSITMRPAWVPARMKKDCQHVMSVSWQLGERTVDGDVEEDARVGSGWPLRQTGGLDRVSHRAWGRGRNKLECKRGKSESPRAKLGRRKFHRVRSLPPPTPLDGFRPADEEDCDWRGREQTARAVGSWAVAADADSRHRRDRSRPPPHPHRSLALVRRRHNRRSWIR